MFKSLAFVASLLIAASAQSVQIGSPTAGSVLKAGSNITVMVETSVRLHPMLHSYERRPHVQVTSSSVTEVALAIGVSYCASAPCNDAPSQLGDLLLHTGSYSPKRAPGNMLPYQNFTVTLPVHTGSAQVVVGHWNLLGVS